MTYSHTVGDGPLLLVVHGGPGFDHQYLVSALRFLTSHYKVVFYDQIGCGKGAASDTKATLNSTAAQFGELVASFGAGSSLTVIAHSWGCLVVAAACCDPVIGPLARRAITSGILVNPVPMTRSKFDAAMAAFVSQIPASTKIRAAAIAALSGDGSAVMRLLMPYYSGDRATVLFDPFPLNLATYKSVIRSLGHFDLMPDASVMARMDVILGAEDPTPPSTIEDVVASARSVTRIIGAGHFPMEEKPEHFRDVVQRCLGIKASG